LTLFEFRRYINYVQTKFGSKISKVPQRGISNHARNLLWHIISNVCLTHVLSMSAILDSPYYNHNTKRNENVVVSLIFKMAYFLSWPVQELLKKAWVRCAIVNSKIFAKTDSIFSFEAAIFISDTTFTTMQSATKM
jgi:hypothetical protein